ncbi:hypothetical protein RHECNPAF_2190017 [Rhizobium etli CNPAF512]|nr:hypothetical protein RHECNPAF_2190017 [Rhizobium etli CNPAF512]
MISAARACPIPRLKTAGTPSSRSLPARSAGPICIFMTASCRTCTAATSWATRPWARSWRSAETTPNSRSATVSSSPSQFPAANAFSASVVFIRAASAPIRIARKSRRCGAIRRPGFSAIHICSAAMPVGRRNICACPMPTSVRSRCRTGSPTSRCFFFRTFFRPATWLRTSAIFNRAIRSRSGAAALSAKWQSAPPSCSALKG